MARELVDFRANSDQLADRLIPNFLKAAWLSLRYRCLVSPSTRILLAGKIRLGKGVLIRGGVITAKTDAATGIAIGCGSLLQPYVSLHSRGDSITIGERVGVNSFCYIDGHGGVTIGSDTLLGPGVRIVGNYDTSDPEVPWCQAGVTKQGISIGRDCWIGANAVIVDGARIGDGCVIGAGAVVTGEIPARSVAVGVPARVVRSR